MTIHQLLGYVQVTSGRLLAIDPCYPEPHDPTIPTLGVLINNVPNGRYPVYFDQHGDDCTAEVSISGRDAITMTTIGHVGVDSGQVFFLDPAQLEFYAAGEFTDFAGGNMKSETRDSYPFDYNGACLATLTSTGGGVLGHEQAVATRTAYGDGVYDLRVGYDMNGNLARIVVVFDEAPAEEDEEGCLNCGADTSGTGDEYCTDCERADEDEDD